ncbi:D-hexose-6-phosphate mutarotase [Pseudoalteromonas fenneropenaei]|uniref:Putative glucose-6-phosphate 1-epimerase n=1 Tax=Pseudoalteromonas fenneropenaei TaxID=1737459 RepID=A0ABV7CKY3_9GAMM
MQLPNSVTLLETATGLSYIQVHSALCQAKIFLQGAQLSEFIPTGQNNLIWVSGDEDYQPGKAIRGGIPICWPWFGVHSDPTWPIHGVARKLMWQLDAVREEGERVLVSLSLPMELVDKTYWPHQSSLSVEFELGTELVVRLTNSNLGDTPFTLTQALHTYFPTPDITQTTVDGLQGAQFIEFDQGPFLQQDVVGFARETDMVYTEAAPEQRIHTPAGTILVGRENSSSCVLWNPWIDKAKRLTNFRDDEYQVMLCLEATNVMQDSATVAPGASHTLTTRLRWL